MVGANGAVERVMGDIPGIEWLQNLAHSVFNVSASGERVAGHASDAGIEDDHAANFVQLRAVCQGVLPGAQQALLLAAEEGEANGAARDKSRRFDGARGF